jgi:hypothetical protein
VQSPRQEAKNLPEHIHGNIGDRIGYYFAYDVMGGIFSVALWVDGIRRKNKSLKYFYLCEQLEQCRETMPAVAAKVSLHFYAERPIALLRLWLRT